MAIDYYKMVRRIGCNGFSCVHCSKTLKSDDLVLSCPDCAAVFCEDCVKDGTFENHRCEDYEYKDDEDVE